MCSGQTDLFIILAVDVYKCSNFNLKHIVTPVKVKVYEKLLRQAMYDSDKTDFLVNGFTNGFSLQYKGTTRIVRKKPNLKLRVGSHLELWEKLWLK